MNAALGHNSPPDPIDDALAPFGDAIAEAENWLDGTPVETEPQMKAVDALVKTIKAAKKAVEAAEESEAKPYYDQWKAAKERYKPTLTDLDVRIKGLVASGDAFKRKLAAEKAEAERKARAAAEEAMRAARKAAEEAAANDYAAQQAAMAAQVEAEIAATKARIAAADTVKGLRTVTRFEVTDHRALLHFIARNDKDAITAFVDAWAQKNHKEHPGADGLRVWQEKESF